MLFLDKVLIDPWVNWGLMDSVGDATVIEFDLAKKDPAKYAEARTMLQVHLDILNSALRQINSLAENV